MKKPKKDCKCEMVMCVDPKTGRVTARPRGKCPDGFIEEMQRAVDDGGIAFIRPRTYIEDEEEAPVEGDSPPVAG